MLTQSDTVVTFNTWTKIPRTTEQQLTCFLEGSVTSVEFGSDTNIDKVPEIFKSFFTEAILMKVGSTLCRKWHGKWAKYRYKSYLWCLKISKLFIAAKKINLLLKMKWIN